MERMHIRLIRLGIRLFLAAILFPVCPLVSVAADKPSAPRQPGVPPQVISFIREKERYIRTLAGEFKLEFPEELVEFLAAARKGDESQLDDLYAVLRDKYPAGSASGDEEKFGAVIWQSALEILLALQEFVRTDPKYALAMGRDIIQSMPRGSIYFGGTDAGRGIVTALSAAPANGDPVFTIAQSALASGRYLTCLRTMFEGQIFTPTSADSQRAFQEYLADAQRRLEHDQKFPQEPRQIKPGEDVRKTGNGVVQVSGQVAVTGINGAIVKAIFDQNSDRQFFVEENYALDWMYPHLTPHGLIMKLNRKPFERIPPEIVQKDRQFWSEQQARCLGKWLTPETPVKEVCRVAEKLFVAKDYQGFSGDQEFLKNERACRNYSRLRTSIGGIYAWRLKNSNDANEKKQMADEADFAFRQAFAFCPYSPEAVFRFAALLNSAKRYDDALLIVELAGKLDVGSANFTDAAKEIRRVKAQQ